MRFRGLYAVTPDGPDVLEKVRRALEGRPALLQYRAKDKSHDSLVLEAREMARLAKSSGVPFIVNDDIELALEVGADGAHLGREDGDLANARARLGKRILGASCYNRMDLARAAVAAGADYVAFGSMFASSTKPGAVRAPLELFSQARSLGVPLCGIGGITLQNAPSLVAAGADLVAVISDLFDAPDIAERARQYREIFQ